MKYLIVSHGPMAGAAVESAEMILGPQPHVFSSSVTMDSTIDSMYSEILRQLSAYPEEDWVILTDIIGGTPFNAAYRVLAERKRVLIVTGFNLPLLLELFMQPDLAWEEAAERVKQLQSGSMSLVDKVAEAAEEEVFDL